MSVTDVNSIRRFFNKQVIATLILALIVAVAVLCPLPPHSTTLKWPLIPASKAATANVLSETAHWPGWRDIKHMVVFGDSISTTGFNIDGEQPSRSNPLGNPDFPGKTSANGENWVGYLSASYNASFIKTVNLASGGATVDTGIIRGMASFIMSFKDQMDQCWLRDYVHPMAHLDFDWEAHDTLFVSFLGTVDLHRAFLDARPDEQIEILERDVKRYGELLDKLYRNGTRSFLIMKTLPLERTPFAETVDQKDRSRLRALVSEFNNNLNLMASKFRDKHPAATVFVFDTHALLNKLIEDPCSMKETCGLKDTTSYCEEYMRDGDDEECEYSIEQYFWLNTLHPSSRVHDALAKAVAAYLERAF